MTPEKAELMPYIDIVFDGPPSHESGRFVEVENAQGKSINFGEWVHRPDGYWALRIGALSPAAQAAKAEDVERVASITETAAVEALCKWRAAFQACTPGGSEFMSPESTRDYMQNLKRETVEAKLETARLRKQLAAFAPASTPPGYVCVPREPDE